MTEEDLDIVERLRYVRTVLKSGDYDGVALMRAWCTAMDGAAEIERLRAEISNLAAQERSGMHLNPSDAQLLLVMLGQSEVSRIRSGAFTGEDFLKLVESLKQIAREG